MWSLKIRANVPRYGTVFKKGYGSPNISRVDLRLHAPEPQVRVTFGICESGISAVGIERFAADRDSVGHCYYLLCCLLISSLSLCFSLFGVSLSLSVFLGRPLGQDCTQSSGTYGMLWQVRKARSGRHREGRLWRAGGREGGGYGTRRSGGGWAVWLSWGGQNKESG